MKKILLFAIALFMSLCSIGQIINQSVFGLNLNLTDTIGTKTDVGGHLEDYWNTTGPLAFQNYISQSNSEQMRYGGILVEQFCKYDGDPADPLSNIAITIKDYIRKALVMKSNGISIMLTLPLFYGNDNNAAILNLTESAQQIAKLVKGVNDGLKAQGAVCTQWIYSNEPEDGGKNILNGKTIHGYDSVDAGVQIHAYIKAYHDAVMNIWGQNQTPWGVDTTQIKFIGPELFAFDNYNHGAGKVDSLIDQLTGINLYHGNNNILPYLSTFSFHFYAFGNEGANMNLVADSTGDFVKATAANLVNILRNDVWVANGNYPRTPLATQLDYLNGIIKTYNNSGIPAYKKVRVAITEANLCYKNDVDSTSDIPEAADLSATGTSSNGLMGGQFWADLLSLCMQKGVDLNFWSAIEGDSTDLYSTDIGFLSGNNTSLGIKKPSFYHFQMLADNYRGSYHGGGYKQNGVLPTPTFPNKGVKTFASAEPAGFHIMILNQNDSAYNFHVNFDSSNTNVTSRITLNLKITNSYGGSLDTSYYNSILPIEGHSTVLLTFNCNGGLISRQDYTLTMAQNNQPPQYRQVGHTVVDPILSASVLAPHSGIGGTINSNTTFTNDTVYVNSNILLTGHTELTFINSLIVMSPGTKIKANPQASIVMKNSVMVGTNKNATYKGFELNGNFQKGERLLIDNSLIYGATNPINSDKIANMKITNSVFANGLTAITLNRSKAFTISGNTIIGYAEGIKTSNTMTGFVSSIKDNRLLSLETAIEFVNDSHDKLDVVCNRLLYKNYGIKSTSTDLKIQGSASLSAGNDFIKTSSIQPADYLNHTGTATEYYYGPSQLAEFSFPAIMNVPIIQASADRACAQMMATTCDPWIDSVTSVNENVLPASGMSVYPNPNEGTFSVSFTNLVKGDCILSVHDVLGRLVSTRNVDYKAVKVTLEITSKGVYFVSMQNGGKIITQKVLVE